MRCPKCDKDNVFYAISLGACVGIFWPITLPGLLAWGVYSMKTVADV